MIDLVDEISACRLCSSRFLGTVTQHTPRPVPWFRPGAKVLICGQAPGMRVHETGRPFDDRSGDRLRDWLKMDEATFYDQTQVAIVPMAFCFPGYNKSGSDLAPPKICAQTWRRRVLASLGNVPLTILIGGYAQNWHLGEKMSVTDRVIGWRDHAPAVFPVPHPSWRNTGWLKKNPWFADELLPELRTQVEKALETNV